MPNRTVNRVARVILAELNRRIEAIKGGEGSGNFGHAGRPGEVGGSGPGDGGDAGNGSDIIGGMNDSSGGSHFSNEVTMKDPKRIEPVNEISKDKVDLLVHRMKENGWQGDPILAYDAGDRIQALTGSHRIVAAREAGIDVPVNMIDTSNFSEDDASVFEVGRDDQETLNSFTELHDRGLVTSEQLQIMDNEVNNNNWEIQASRERDLQKQAARPTPKIEPPEPSNVTQANRDKLDGFLNRMRDKYSNIYQDMSDSEMEEMERIERETYKKSNSTKTYDEYRSRLWRAAVRLFNGGRDANFLASFARSIDQQLTQAWNTGADDVGVSPDEMTPDDMAIIEAIINNENDFIDRLAGDIQADKDAGMTRDDFDKQYGARTDLWAQRYVETVNRAHMQFGAKERMIWELGSTEEHCETCQQLDGIVAFGSEWEQAHLQPQAPPNAQLACSGWRCDCRLTPTTQRRTPRAFDKLTQIVTSSHL
jgi:hypothetical protein